MTTKNMTTKIMAAIVAGVVGVASLAPVAQADRRGDRDHSRSYHSERHYRHAGRHHRHGYWRDGKWIALGIIGGAALNALDDDCYRTRRGRVVCD
jgi:hypothetical protein